MTQRQFRISVAVFTLASLFFRWLVPPNPGYNSNHDDQLLVIMAHNILQGNWVGSYEEMGHLVLSKPAGYSIFLAWTHWLPWAPTVTIHMMLLAGFLLILRELRAFDFARSFLATAYLFICFMPIWFSETMSRIYRDGLLAALTIVFLGLVLLLRRALITANDQENLKFISLRSIVLCGATIGMVAGFFVVTKPSWHFLVVIFAAIIGGSFISDVRPRTKKTAKLYGLVLVVIAVFFNVFPTYVKVQNQRHFGIYAIDSFSKGNYPEAMKAIYKVKDYQNRPYIDSTRQTRTAIYRISPTMSQLKGFLELPDDNGWRSQPCHSDLGVCDESGAWFPWEVRDAIQKAGLGDSAIEFEKTSAKIAREIRLGCREKRIVCEREGIAPGLDSLDSLSPRVVVDAFAKGFQFILNPMTGTQERGEFRDLSEEVKQLWDTTIKGLPPREFATKYESNDLFLGDVRRTLGLFYGSIWIPMILLSAMGFVMRRRSAPRNVSDNLRFLGIALILGIGVLILQISMLQASSGYYMNSGGDLYLLPLHPLLVIFIVAGVYRLVLSLKHEVLKFKDA